MNVKNRADHKIELFSFKLDKCIQVWLNLVTTFDNFDSEMNARAIFCISSARIKVGCGRKLTRFTSHLLPTEFPPHIPNGIPFPLPSSNVKILAWNHCSMQWRLIGMTENMKILPGWWKKCTIYQGLVVKFEIQYAFEDVKQTKKKMRCELWGFYALATWQSDFRWRTIPCPTVSKYSLSLSLEIECKHGIWWSTKKQQLIFGHKRRIPMNHMCRLSTESLWIRPTTPNDCIH